MSNIIYFKLVKEAVTALSYPGTASFFSGKTTMLVYYLLVGIYIFTVQHRRGFLNREIG